MRPLVPRRRPSPAIADAERAREVIAWRLMTASESDVAELRGLLEAADRRLPELRGVEGARP